MLHETSSLLVDANQTTARSGAFLHTRESRKWYFCSGTRIYLGLLGKAVTSFLYLPDSQKTDHFVLDSPTSSFGFVYISSQVVELNHRITD